MKMRSTSRPVISIVIPTHNRAHLIRPALESCAAASLTTPLEVIVVDDGSEDDTKGLVQELSTELCRGHPNFSLHYSWQQNQGACVARNTGMTKARGDFLKFLDSDDYLIPSATAAEVAEAKSTRADVIVTGWCEVRIEDGTELPDSRVTRDAPQLKHGVDDMLLGRAPWTSAALYRMEFVSDLCWDSDWFKAQDWAWVWRVCLAGARFAVLPVSSCVYCHRLGTDRITGQEQSFLRSTEARQMILRMAENGIRENGWLTPERARLLAQYYYRDSKVLAEHYPEQWKSVWRHCQTLCPDFRPREDVRRARLPVKFLGPYFGSVAYVRLRKYMRHVARRDPNTG
jgi:glycosyltransferase involved in cell wall biosynthesis